MRVGLQLFCAVALAVFVFDQVSKYWAVSELTLANSTLYGETKAEEFGDKFERFWRVEHPARGRVVEVVADFWHFRYAFGKPRRCIWILIPQRLAVAETTRRGGHHSSWS